MLFDVVGPFNLKRHGNKNLITDQTRKDLKPQLDELELGLADACGCYVFAVRAGKGYTPHYVGQAYKTSILGEALNSANLNKYNKVLDKKGAPVIFLLPMRTPGGKLKKRSTTKRTNASIDFLEEWLIATAIQKNRNLVNNRQTKFLRTIRVKGVFNAGKGEATQSSTLLRKTLW